MSNEVQPIDEYVRGLLKHAKEKYMIDIDLDKPTRAQRLEVALAMQNEGHGFCSAEIMVGRRISSNEDDVTFLLTTQKMCPQDPRKFYDDFAHDYWPKQE